MIEAPVTGTSLNPAATLGPAILAPNYAALWVYFVGPVAGALLAVGAFSGQWGSRPSAPSCITRKSIPARSTAAATARSRG
jgi:hypothetical protein